jgi:uncharacterized protein (DUF2461 family)
MTFEEFIESTQSLCWSEDERELVEMVWRVAQEAERNRINALVIKVRAEGNFAGTAWWDSAEEIRRLIHAQVNCYFDGSGNK